MQDIFCWLKYMCTYMFKHVYMQKTFKKLYMHIIMFTHIYTYYQYLDNYELYMHMESTYLQIHMPKFR